MVSFSASPSRLGAAPFFIHFLTWVLTINPCRCFVVILRRETSSLVLLQSSTLSKQDDGAARTLSSMEVTAGLYENHNMNNEVGINKRMRKIPPETVETETHQPRFPKVDLIPLSCDPILCWSSHPVLTSDECQILVDWCRQSNESNTSIADRLLQDGHSEGARLMRQLQQIVHHSVLGMGIEDEDYVVPRYLQYEPSKMGHCSTLSSDSPFSRHDLLPDGLHVDTNNNKHFRHWTVLVYLNLAPSTLSGGATTFPLAKRLGSYSLTHSDIDDEMLQQAARELIYNHDQHHTGLSKDNERIRQLGNLLEVAAWELYYSETSSRSIPSDERKTSGIRILPQQGHICLFSGLKEDGYPNPRSFHAGEAIQGYRNHKDVLTFFYEIPTHEFRNRAEFGQCVQQRHEFLLQFHGLPTWKEPKFLL